MSSNNAHSRSPFVEQMPRMKSPTLLNIYEQLEQHLRKDMDSGDSFEEDTRCCENHVNVCVNENEDSETYGNPDIKSVPSTSRSDHAGSVPLHFIMVKAPPEVKARLLKEHDTIHQQQGQLGLLNHSKHKRINLISLPVSSRTRAKMI